MAPPPPPPSRGDKSPLYSDAIARRALRPPLSRSVSVPSEPPPPPPMDVTYAVIAKPRRGGGANGGGHAPSDRDHAPFGRGHAPFGCSSLPASPRRRRSPPPPEGPPLVAYEVVKPPQGDPGTPPTLGFNFRIPKPKGPRDPPPEWTRV